MLSNANSVRLIQINEGHQPCFGRESPLAPIRSSPHLCAIAECCWREECDAPRRSVAARKDDVGYMGSAKFNHDLRERIVEKAARLGCAHQITDLSDASAIRLLQQREGYTPCFGRETPFRAAPESPTRCDVKECYWRAVCDGYRVGDAKPMDVGLPGASRFTLDLLRERIALANDARDTLLDEASTGLQLRSFQNIDSLTRKMLVAAPTTVIGEAAQNPVGLRPYVLAERKRLIGSPYSTAFAVSDFDVLFTADLGNLSRWLLDTQAFFEAGQLRYHPLVETITVKNDTPIHKQVVANARFIPDFAFVRIPVLPELKTFSAPHLGLPDGDVMLSSAEFSPILNLDLPVLENIDLATLARLMSDFPDELCAFRGFLHSSVEQMRSAAVGSAEFSRDCRKIERDIREHLRKLDSDYRKNQLKSAFELTGCAVASWTLALYCILYNQGDALTFLGPGGILYKVSTAYSDYLVKQLALKENPVYFLWLLGRTRR